MNENWGLGLKERVPAAIKGVAACEARAYESVAVPGALNQVLGTLMDGMQYDPENVQEAEIDPSATLLCVAVNTPVVVNDPTAPVISRASNTALIVGLS